MKLLQTLPFPLDVIKLIDIFLGGEVYWNARSELTLTNTKLNMFSSNWWSSHHAYLKWYHWHKRNTPYIHTHTIGKQSNGIPPATFIENSMPLRFRLILDDTQIKLLIKLYQCSVDHPQMLHLLDTKLDILYNTWLSHAAYYREIVFS